MTWFDRWFNTGPRAFPEPPNLFATSEEGWCDCGFSIERSWAEQATRMLHAVARDGVSLVGIHVALDSDWELVDFGPDFPVAAYRGIVRLRSAGGESDALLRALDREFQTGQAPESMAVETTLTGISLGGDPRQLDRGPAKIKLFFEPDNESEYDVRYFEWYLNIALPEGRLELNEKDEEYRAAIVRVLAGQ